MWGYVVQCCWHINNKKWQRIDSLIRRYNIIWMVPWFFSFFFMNEWMVPLLLGETCSLNFCCVMTLFSTYNHHEYLTMRRSNKKPTLDNFGVIFIFDIYKSNMHGFIYIYIYIYFLTIYVTPQILSSSRNVVL